MYVLECRARIAPKVHGLLLGWYSVFRPTAEQG